MSRLLALEWDAHEARVVVARTRGRDIVVEHAFAVELAPRDPGQTFADVSVGERIASALAARNVTRCETFVAVGRANIELRQLTLPPSPPDELPELVRFQALRQFTGIGDDWPLDFIDLEAGDPDSMSVLAATVSPEMVEQIKQTCQAGDLTPRRLVMRPFAAASLLRRHDAASEQPCRLMVDLLADEADLTVLVNQQVALVRTVRLPATEDVTVQSRALLGEIRRTVAAAHNQLRDQRVEQVVVCGDGQEQAMISELIKDELGQEVGSFDPFEGVQLRAELRAHKPPHSGRFAPLLGLLLDEAQGAGHAIDFLHPRQKAAPPNRRRRNLLVAGVTVAAIFAAVFAGWSRLNSLDADIQRLAGRQEGLKKAVATAEQRSTEAGAVEEFLESDIPWLDELYRLSEDMPPPEEVIVTQLTLSTRQPNGGQMVLDAYTRDYDGVQALERALRASDRRVFGSGTGEDPRRDKYPWRAKETVTIEPVPVTAPDAEIEQPDAEAKTAAVTEEGSTSR